MASKCKERVERDHIMEPCQKCKNTEKWVRWGCDLKNHGEVKGNAIRFVAKRSLLHTLLGAAAGAVVGGTVGRTFQDAAGMAVMVGGVSGVLSGLCQYSRARFDRIAEHKNELIRRALKNQISPEQVVNFKSVINHKASWLNRGDVDYITGKVFDFRHGNVLLATNIGEN